MDAGPPQPPHSSQFEQFWTWLLIHRTRVIVIAGATIILILLISAYISHESRKESRASQALSEVPGSINVSTSLPPGAIQGYLDVARQYKGTKAAGRAILMAAAGLFMEGDYEKAQAQFERYLQEYPADLWAGQAALGRAKCLDAKRQLGEAEKEYESIRKRFANTPFADEATLGLARLYEAQAKPEEAIKLYHSLAEASFGSIRDRAGLRKEEMIKLNPALTNSLPAPPLPPVTELPPPMIPFAPSNIPGQTTITQNIPNLTNIVRLTPTTAAPVTVVTSAPVAAQVTNVIEVKPQPTTAPSNPAAPPKP